MYKLLERRDGALLVNALTPPCEEIGKPCYQVGRETQTDGPVNDNVLLVVVGKFKLYFVRITTCLSGFNALSNSVPHFSVLDWAREKGSVPLTYDSFDAGHHPRSIRWVYCDSLCWEAVVEGFRGGGDLIAPNQQYTTPSTAGPELMEEMKILHHSHLRHSLPRLKDRHNVCIA
ncbi:hypothetical protein E2C01_027829 [Portunus trituberculatus]|uniref:Uncharacterized protein n=1 Tax=Portunus trituberculatus TaxID=210409 RepID=A0A5B7EMD2_PORTR|nr:hypothetical protein [Portunus trituberculatus]